MVLLFSDYIVSQIQSFIDAHGMELQKLVNKCIENNGLLKIMHIIQGEALDHYAVFTTHEAICFALWDEIPK